MNKIIQELLNVDGLIFDYLTDHTENGFEEIPELDVAHTTLHQVIQTLRNIWDL